MCCLLKKAMFRFDEYNVVYEGKYYNQNLKMMLRLFPISVQIKRKLLL